MSAPANPSPDRCWVTRDCLHGVLSDRLDVWIAKPVPAFYDDGDVVWFPNRESQDTHLAQIPVADARKYVPSGAYPETPRECLVTG